MIELVELSLFERFVSQQSRWGLMALWRGKQSILKAIFPDRNAATLLKINASSILLLKSMPGIPHADWAGPGASIQKGLCLKALPARLPRTAKTGTITRSDASPVTIHVRAGKTLYAPENSSPAACRT